MIDQSEQDRPLSISISATFDCSSANKFTDTVRGEIGDVFAEAAASSNTHSPNVKTIGIHLHLSENTRIKAPYIGRISRINNWIGAGIELNWFVARDLDEQTIRMMMGKPLLGLLLGAFKTFEVPKAAFLNLLSAYPGWNEVIESLTESELEYYASCASATPVSMDEESFWAVFEKAKQRSPGSNAEREKLLIAELLKLPPEDIGEFNVIFHIKMAELYRWDLWAIGYIINGGCSDDGFTYFRAWLICQGRDFYMQALARPEFVGEQVTVEAAAWKAPNRASSEFDNVSSGVYKEKNGYELYFDYAGMPEDPAGDQWAEEDLPTLYPSICEKFQY